MAQATQPSELLTVMADLTLALLGKDWAKDVESDPMLVNKGRAMHDFIFRLTAEERSGFTLTEMQKIQAFALLSNGVLFSCTRQGRPALCVSVMENIPQ